MQDLDEKPRVEEVQDRMLDATGVLIHGHPVVRKLRVERLRALMWAGVAQEVPGRVDKGVHRVCLTARLATALRTLRLPELRALRQRPVLLRQRHRQLVFRHSHDAVDLAVDNRDRTSPVTLPRDEPVTQPVLDGPTALALGLERLHNSLDTRLRVKPVELAAVDHRALTHVRLAKLTLRAGRWGDDLANR